MLHLHRLDDKQRLAAESRRRLVKTTITLPCIGVHHTTPIHVLRVTSKRIGEFDLDGAAAFQRRDGIARGSSRVRASIHRNQQQWNSKPVRGVVLTQCTVRGFMIL
ncbi:hypothetical protein [Breoghania sp. L-A4]|uniref:hypothetical protein n=1 Tax=Breoghania sp. L-A4 TaxID=2304600 RepID=UPI0013C30195|nr:hypothetical protein [Breoghania sp. L-A4]